MQERKSNTTKLPKADGFINLVLIDKEENRHTFKMGIPLYNGRKMDSLLLGDPDLLSRLTIEQVELTVNPIKPAVEPVF